MSPILAETPQITLPGTPDRLVMFIPGLKPNRARVMANAAVAQARKTMPKATGYSANRLQPLYGKDYFGVRWADAYVYFQEHGIQPFTMWKLEGKTIPMWVKDPTGQERRKNPKAKTRVTLSGVTEVLIFRKAAKRGTRKTTYRRNPITGAREIAKDAPASYPGAPGRIANREAAAPATTPGRVAGAIARGNVGVRWRHPGLAPRLFLNNAMTLSCQWHGIIPLRLYVADERWRQFVHGAEFGL